MRNRYAGTCACGTYVEAGEGFYDGGVECSPYLCGRDQERPDWLADYPVEVQKEGLVDVSSLLSCAVEYERALRRACKAALAGPPPPPVLTEEEIARRAEHDARGRERDLDWERAGFHRCKRCGGAGGSSGWPGWACYDCGGHGAVPVEVSR